MQAEDFGPVGRISFADVFARSFRLVRREWRALCLLSVLFVWAPSEVVAVLSAAAARAGGSPLLFGAGVIGPVGYFAIVLCLGVGTGGSVAILLDRIDGVRPSMRRALGRAARAMLVGAATVALANAPILFFVVRGMPQSYGAYVLLLVADNVAVMIWSIFLGATLPIALDERWGLLRSIGHAARLSRGQRLRLLPITLCCQLVFVIGQEATVILGTAELGDGAIHLEYAWVALSYLPIFAISAVIYRELWRASGGVSAAEAAAVFD